MTIDPAAIARVVGIDTQFQDLRQGSVLFLPQRLAIFAQGETGVTYSTTKQQFTSAAAAGAIYGFGSPIYLALRELFPANGDGVGTLPVTVYPLAEHGSGTVAAGDVTPSGTPTATSELRLRIAGYLSNSFTLAKSALTGTVLSDLLRKMGLAVSAVLHMPVSVGWTYGTITAEPDGDNTGDGTVTSLSDTGEPLPGDWTLTVNAAPGAEQATFTLTDPEGTVVSDEIELNDGSGGTEVVNLAGLQFTITDGAADFVVGDFFTITVPATQLDLTSRWKGASANDIEIEVIGETQGATFAITQPTGGTNNPDVSAALNQVGQIWETMGLNALNHDDTTALDDFKTFGEGLWVAAEPRPLVVFHGNTDKTVADATSVTSGRNEDDRVNVQLVAPGSPNLPFVVAARQLARIAVVANNNPPRPYSGQRATGLVPGLDSEQWDHTERDQALKAGSSTIEVSGGVIEISQVVTPWAPQGEPTPAYRFVRDIVKLQNIIYNLRLIFASSDWKGKILIPDEQPTVNPDARRPSAAKAAVNGMIDSLGLNAFISAPGVAKKKTTATIDSQNSNRLNVGMTVQLSAGTDIIDVSLNFGFFFETAEAS